MMTSSSWMVTAQFGDRARPERHSTRAAWCGASKFSNDQEKVHGISGCDDIRRRPTASRSWRSSISSALSVISSFRIDRFGTAGPLLQSVVVNTLLIGLFALQHSVMARQGFKRWWTRIGPTAGRAAPMCCSPVSRCCSCTGSGAHPRPRLERAQPGRRGGARRHLLAGWVVLVASTFLIGHFELFGLSQVFGGLFGKPMADAKFRTPLLYRHVRHPIYLGVLLAVWATPAMTVGICCSRC